MTDKNTTSENDAQGRQIRELANVGRVPSGWEFATKSFVVLIGFLLGFPLYFMFVSSTYPLGELFVFPPHLLPGDALIENYITVVRDTIFLRTLLNSFIFAAVSVTGVLMVSAPAGYALAKFEFRGSRTLLVTLLVLMAIPFHLISIPLFALIVDLNLINTWTGAILPMIAVPIGVIFVKQNAEQILTDDLLNSARMDGASELQVFLKIVLPLLWPGLLAIGMYLFIVRMQAYYWPLIVLQDDSMMVSQVWISQWEGGVETPTPYDTILPASVMITIPLLVIFLIGQKQFIEGLTGGSIKG